MVGSSEDRSAWGEIRRGLRMLLVAGICGVGLMYAGFPQAFGPTEQLDFQAYYYAEKVYEAGGDPYDHAQVVHMADGAANALVYPPHSLLFFGLFSFDDVRTAKDVFLAVKLACLAALCVLWTTCFVREGARGWFLAFASLGYNACICRDLVVGNLSLIEQTPIWFALWALLRRRTWLFCVLIILAGQFKILPLCLLGLVLLTNVRGKWAYFLGSLVVCGLVAVGVYLSNPEMSRAYWRLILDVGIMEPGGAIHPCSRTLITGVVEKLMAAFPSLDAVRPKTVGLPIYVCYALAVLLVYLRAVRRGMDLRTMVFLGLVTYVLIAPRMKDYSYILVLVPTFELIRSRLARPGGGRTLILVVGAMLALPGLDLLWTYRSLLLVGWVWAVTVWGGKDEGGRLKDEAPARCWVRV